MPTDNPKISLYVPQQVYDCFKEFQQDQNLSMSQAGIVILAEYFGLEEIIKETTEGTTIGGVTLAEFQELKDRVLKLEKQELEKKVIPKKIIKELPAEETHHQMDMSDIPENKEQNKVDISEISILTKVLALRLGVKTNSVSSRKAKKPDEFATWSAKKDPDGIAWMPETRKTFTPVEKSIPQELLSKLQKWITENTEAIEGVKTS